MPYKYITENNLINKQTYMYSEYGGRQFLEQYKQVREAICKRSIEVDSNMHIARDELRELSDGMKTSGQMDEVLKHQLDMYTKSFEVRKRIYTEYTSDWKPLDHAGYMDVDNYLLFAECLVKGYDRSACTKYVSCLLKVDDTLLSIENQMTDRQRLKLQQTIGDELRIVSQLQKVMGVEE